MAVRLSNAAANACIGDNSNKGLTALIGAGCILNFYTGNVNASAESAPSGTLLGAVTLATFGTGTTGVITSTGGSATVASSGTLGCWQLTTSGAAIIADGACNTTGSDINFAGGLGVLAGGTLTIGSTTITVPAH